MKLTTIAAASLLLAASASSPRAELAEITIAQQFGVSFLPLMLMERDALIEKHAKAAGIAVKTNWQKVAGPSVINDGLLSGNVQFGAVGAPSLITLWSRTKSNVGVKGVAAMTSYPLYFVTRNPELKSLKDLSGKDKIAVPSVKISTQAIMLQMAAADLFGQENYQKFDELTVSLSHPDAMLALMNNTGGVNAHFATSPFYEQEMKIPGARVLTTSYDILGGRASALVVVTTTRFHDANPKLYKAFLAAQKEAIDTINKDKRKAAQDYLDIAQDRKSALDEIFGVISDKDYAFTLLPEKVFKTAVFMGKVGTVKDPPAKWQDLFFPDIHGLPGD
jgi:NitT/TauT family transport system substrate-binding protein